VRVRAQQQQQGQQQQQQQQQEQQQLLRPLHELDPKELQDIAEQDATSLAVLHLVLLNKARAT